MFAESTITYSLSEFIIFKASHQQPHKFCSMLIWGDFRLQPLLYWFVKAVAYFRYNNNNNNNTFILPLMTVEHPGSHEWCYNTRLHTHYADRLLSVIMRPDAEKQNLPCVLQNIEIYFKVRRRSKLSPCLKGIEIYLKKEEDQKK